MPDPKLDRLQGTLDLMVLQTRDTADRLAAVMARVFASAGESS